MSCVEAPFDTKTQSKSKHFEETIIGFFWKLHKTVQMWNLDRIPLSLSNSSNDTITPHLYSMNIKLKAKILLTNEKK